MEFWWFPGGSRNRLGDIVMATQNISKRLVDSLEAIGAEYFVWDGNLKGFGIRVRETGAKSYIVKYRAGTGRKAPTRRMTIAAVGKVAPDAARAMADSRIIGDVARGDDPASERTRERREMTIREVADRYVSEHVRPHNINKYLDVHAAYCKDGF